MIPRIIHYTWFSGEPFPAKVQECIDSWHRYMPDWEFRLWDAHSLQAIESPWLTECLEAHKWAFAADFVRCYAVYWYGGVYLDTDCLVFRSFDSLLCNSAFIGREWYVNISHYVTERYLTSHCFGAEPRHPFVGLCLHYYDGRHFHRSADSSLPSSLRFDQTLLPLIQCEIARSHYNYDPRPSSEGKEAAYLLSQSGDSKLAVFPHSFFDCYTLYSHTYCRHLALGGWSEDNRQRVLASGFWSRVRISLRYRFRHLVWRLGYIITDLQ